MSNLHKEVLNRGLPPKLLPASGAAKKLPRGRDFTPLPWTEFFDEERTVEVDGDSFHVYLRGTSGPVFYLLHGGGYSGLTWSQFATELSSRIECRVVAPDLRGHGLTACEQEMDLSTETQCRDIGNIISKLFVGEEVPPIIVIGHSMGGALAVHSVSRDVVPNCVGLGVIDVVEGSAMDALSQMVQFLRSRPTIFESAERAIQWCLQSGTVRNSKSARVSMPSQLKKNDDGKYTWRIDLTATESHWVGWFKGLSSLFLSCAPPKVLVLAGTDRLDKELMIGQMQGKFQTTMLPRVGHAVQEDSPDRLADEFARFAVRHKLAVAKSGIEFNALMC